MNDDQKTGALEESPGVISSKRLFGAILISIGGAFLLAIGIAAMFIEVKDPDTALSAGQVLIITGAALLGVTVLEGIARTRTGGAA